MVGVFVAASVVTLLQYLRVRDRRLLLLATMFACQAQALGREWHDGWRDVYQAGVCAAGLMLLLALSTRQPHESAKGRAAAPQPAPAAAGAASSAATMASPSDASPRGADGRGPGAEEPRSS